MITTATESDFHDFWYNEMIAHPTDIIDRDKLQANYINRILDDMDIKDMMAILYDYMDVEFDKYTIDELIEQVDSDYPEIMEDSGFDN